jgi:hypothetical protein
VFVDRAAAESHDHKNKLGGQNIYFAHLEKQHFFVASSFLLVASHRPSQNGKNISRQRHRDTHTTTAAGKTRKNNFKNKKARIAINVFHRMTNVATSLYDNYS